jgi:hypothetical protein
MRTWDYDITTLGTGPAAERWELERKILYGLNGTKLNADRLRRHLPYLNIPEDRRAFLQLILT